MKNKKERVFVAMSGGVDSSVAALLLKRNGYDIVGVFMRSYNIDGCEERDAEDARRVAGKLGIPFYVWDFEEEYKKKVVDYMIDGYRRGLTPNPDVMCNKEIKFGLFLERALKFGADYIATGHYVRRQVIKLKVPKVFKVGKKKDHQLYELYKLLTACDSAKDQSYFLWTLTQEQLKHCLFPLGDYLKPEVRKIAKKAGLSTAEKKDSQGICFLGKVTLADFLSGYLPAKKGVVFNTGGEIIGKHSGAHFYTIGQRHGLASGDWKRTTSVSKPFYVADKNVGNNTIVAVEGDNKPELFRKEVELSNLNFINPFTIGDSPLAVFARVRYRQPLFRATLVAVRNVRNVQNAKKQFEHVKQSNKRSNQTFELVFDKPVKFVAPGQSAVFYSKSGQVLGGGIIV